MVVLGYSLARSNAFENKPGSAPGTGGEAIIGGLTTGTAAVNPEGEGGGTTPSKE